MLKSNVLLCGALAAALAIPGVVQAKTIKLAATLSGANETAGGDPDGSGSFSAEIDSDVGDLCYTLSVSNIAAPVAAHIHSGAAGTDGAPVATLEVTGEDLDECLAVEPDTLKAIVATPADYYVNVHTADFQKGAVRGQLAKGN